MKKENILWKKKLYFSFAIITTVVLVLGSKSGLIVEPQASPPPVYTNVSDSFIIGAMDMGGQSGYEYYHPPFSVYNSHFNYYQQYDSMNFNLWHKYTIIQNSFPRALPYGWWETMYRDSLNAHIDVYRPGVHQTLDSNNGRNMKTLMLRPKIEWLCFGQRSDYQCEFIPLDSGDYWFYSYDSSQTGIDIIDGTIYGNGVKVKYCEADTSNPGSDSGYVVKNLRSNREQVNTIEASQGDMQCPWLIKPRIRIDSNEVDNFPNKKVCRIDVYDYYGESHDSNKIKSVDIYVRDFDFLRIHNYNGKYLEEYFFSPSQPASTIKIDTGKQFNPYGEQYFWTNACKADFRVYWYGLCDMWIDYVRVDNDVADRLLSGVDEQFEEWFEWEAIEIAQHGTSPFKFYIEEFEFNNLPCIKEVNKKLMYHNGNISLMANINLGLINAHLPFGSYPGFDNLKIKAGYISRYIIDSAKLKELFISNYPIRGESGVSKIPNTLGSYFSGAGYDPINGILADYASPNVYDDWLQGYLDISGEGVKTFKIVDTISRKSQVPSIQLVQSHLSYEPLVRFREPTIQEQEVLVDLGICYGGRGIMYFT